METSDSDYFESADEDFCSEDEQTNSVIKNVSVKTETVLETTKNIEKIDLKSDGNKETDKKQPKVCKISNKLGTKHETKVLKSASSKKDNPSCDQEKILTHTEPESVDTIQTKEEIEVKTNVLEEDLWEHDEIDWNEVETVTKTQKETTTSKPSINQCENITATSSKDLKINQCPIQNAPKEENMWEDDEWEPLEDNLEKKNENLEAGWGNWGNWGVTSILNTATQGVTTLTSHVSHGLTTVLETSIGVPDPEELAKINKAEKEKVKLENDPQQVDDDKQPNLSLGGFGLSNFVSGVSQITKLVETTSNKVISGGLDTLETIGKKTMEVLQEGDPGLKKKRAFLQINQDKPVLSQLLREAKEKVEEENKLLEQKHYAKKANYESLFDDHQGLVHLEALEMLSKQCDIKLQTLAETYTGNILTEMQETMEQVKELCEIPEDEEEESLQLEDIKEKLKTAVDEISIPICYNKLITTWEETDEWLNNLNLNVCSERELHQQAIETLAQLTASAVEQFHKTGELLLVKEHRSTADEADSLVQLTTTITSLIGIVAAKFSDKLNTIASKLDDKKQVNNLITNVFFEAANSSSYIQDAFQLLIPVIQVGAI